jgi:dolichyl-phosphate beta-glucosyltransferase
MLSIIIPAYNEEKRLPKALDPIISYMKDKRISNEIIIVADKSKDKTLEVVRGFAKKYSNISYIFNPKKQGKGYAIKKGVLASKGDLVLFADADTSTPITELDKFLAKIKGYDIIIGSREHKDSNVKNKLLSRVVLGNLGNILLRIFLIRKIKDTQCGFKLFKGDIARKLFSMSRINGFGFDFEIIFLAQSRGYKINEMPVNWTYCPGTKVTWQSHFKTLSEMFEIRLNYLLGRYKLR